MKITFLGVGSAFSKKYFNSNVLVESGDVKLLIDCGRSAPSSVEQIGFSLEDVTHILITHLHADHIGGLEEVAIMSRLVYRHRITLVSSASMLDRLWRNSMSGGLEYIEEVPGESAPQRLEDYFDVQKVDPAEPFLVGAAGGLRVRLHPTYHVLGMESYAVEMEAEEGGRDRRFLFSGDLKFTPALIRHGATQCALTFHDCQLFNQGENNEAGVHTSYSQLLTLPAEDRASLYLYHYGDEKLPNAKSDGFRGFVKQHQTFTL